MRYANHWINAIQAAVFDFRGSGYRPIQLIYLTIISSHASSGRVSADGSALGERLGNQKDSNPMAYNLLHCMPSCRFLLQWISDPLPLGSSIKMHHRKRSC